jgi:hypothetical protein
MQDIIRISIDERRFTIWNRIGFAFLFVFLTLHALGFSFGVIGAIWSKVLVGDFTRLDLVWAIGLTIIALPAVWAFYGILYIAAFQEEPFTRVSVLLDSSSGNLILRSQHVTGLFRERSISVTDIEDLRVTWNKDEDGKDIPKLELLAKCKSVYPIVTNPADSSDLPAFAARLRNELAAAARTDSPECRCPQGETGSDRR